jgi:hypothetical protein
MITRRGGLNCVRLTSCLTSEICRKVWNGVAVLSAYYNLVTYEKTHSKFLILLRNSPLHEAVRL